MSASSESTGPGRVGWALIGMLGAVGLGLAIWLWASTKPELVLGEDVPTRAVLEALAAFLLAVAVIGGVYFRARSSSPAEMAGEASAHATANGEVAADTEAPAGDETATSQSQSAGASAEASEAASSDDSTRNERDPNPPTEAADDSAAYEQGGTVHEEANPAQVEADIALENNSQTEDFGDESPNPDRPAADAAGRTQSTDAEISPADRGTPRPRDDVTEGDDHIQPAARDRDSDDNREQDGIDPAPREYIPEWLRGLGDQSRE